MFLVFLGIVLFACMARGSRRRAWARSERFRDEPSEPHRHEPPAAAEERFEAWHRAAHGDEPAAAPAPDSDETLRA